MLSYLFVDTQVLIFNSFVNLVDLDAEPEKIEKLKNLNHWELDTIGVVNFIIDCGSL